MNVGSLVHYRERDWVVLPSDEAQVIRLRPIGGSTREECSVLLPLNQLLGFSLPFERIESSQFPLPDAAEVQDHAAIRLLMDASRLLLREGAAPFRSFGHISIRPRPYQLVPLLMALRLDTVRMLIADDVGVGKTIEAGLIARELLDRGDVQRLAVVCPPYLCEQWQKELAEKFHIEAVIVRSGTIARLERHKPAHKTIFEYYPHLVVSIDLAKSERYRDSFVEHCPELVIVDEVHGAAQPHGNHRSSTQQQRHELLKKLAATDRHLLLLTATPHSGVEESFRSILGLLKPKFQSFDLAQLPEKQRAELAKHFIQRRRGDVRHWLGDDTKFPERESLEKPYTFSPEYQKFYRDLYAFASGLVQSAEELQGWKRRMRFWSALALLRCVASSPAATQATLEQRRKGETTVEADELTTPDALDAAFEPVLFDAESEVTEDAPPSNVLGMQEQDPHFGESNQRRLREFQTRAAALRGSADHKLKKLVEVTQELLREGFQPIVWCRYIATADYVAAELQTRLAAQFSNVRVVSVTGALSDDERRLKVDDLSAAPRRVLVATDCLSEGINLQDHFNAVVHYDLPWNPNRLEQREGRVDRFGQNADKVKAILVYGQDNPVDGAVLDVLLRKAREIYRRLGVYVPVPVDSESVMEAVLRSLFARAQTPPASGAQMALFDPDPSTSEMLKQVNQEWDRAEEREKVSRSRFAQHALSKEMQDDVLRELQETDRVLGTPSDVRRFLVEASQRLPFPFTPASQKIWQVGAAGLPPVVRQHVGNVPAQWHVTFDSPAPEKVSFVGRNHPLVEALSEYVFDLAFHPATGQPPASRGGVVRTRAVKRQTTLLLLRVRYLVYERKDGQPTLAEETLLWGFEGLVPDVTPLSPEHTQTLMDTVTAAGNVSNAEKRELLQAALGDWSRLQHALNPALQERAAHLSETHQRIRQLLGQRKVRIEPQTPPDLLGMLVLQPVITTG